jgi:hypothetical protein
VKRAPMPPRKRPMNRRAANLARNQQARQRLGRTEAEVAIREQVYDRDGRRCILAGSLWGPCGGRLLTPHHLRKEGRGGAYTVVNLVTLCSVHNDAVELRPLDSHALGLVIRNGEHYVSAWCRLQAHGLVAYWWDGSPAGGPCPPLST